MSEKPTDTERLVKALIENRDRDYAASVYKFTPDKMATALLPLVTQMRAEAFDQALAQVTEGVKRAKKAHAECGETHRQAVSVLVSLEIAIPKTENPYRKEAEHG